MFGQDKISKYVDNNISVITFSFKNAWTEFAECPQESFMQWLKITREIHDNSQICWKNYYEMLKKVFKNS